MVPYPYGFISTPSLRRAFMDRIHLSSPPVNRVLLLLSSRQPYLPFLLLPESF